MDYFTVSGSQEQSSEPTPDDERQESLLPLSTSTSTSPAQQQQGQGSVSPPTTSNTGASASNTALGSASTPRIRRRNPSQLKLTEIKEKVGSLERLLERDVAKYATIPSTTSPSQERALPDDADLLALEDEKDLEPTPLAVVDAAYGQDGEDDDLLDLGIQMGKMRITERIGGFFRPKISQELAFTMHDTFMTGHRDGTTDGQSPAQNIEALPPANDWLKPGPAYIAPSSDFFFGQGGQQASLIDFLPSRLAADRLVKQYFQAVHPIAQIVHRPTFEEEYDTFWDEVSLGIEPPSSVQAIVFAATFSGVVSMDEATIIRDFGVSKSSLIDNFRLGTETALGRANFLRTTKIETLQAFVMYLIPLCRAEVSRAHSVLLGAAIRMAECMGLHRDGQNYGMNPLETHVRRLIWHQLCFLDIRTCEAQGPRPTIRREDFDCKLPLNIDDMDLHASGKPPIPADRWTDSTFSLIRFEINEMIRSIWIDRPRIEQRKISLTAVLGKIETFKANMTARYDHLIDDRIPLQKCAKVVKALLLSRLHIMVLHRYHNSVVSSMPDRLRNIMLASGTITLEMSVTLDTHPDLRHWAWYSGALQQYHTAFLLLLEVYVYPTRREADRIWTCLDYIFECDPSEYRSVKAKKVLSELQRKTAVYQSIRGMRAPIAMEKHLGQRPPRISESNFRGLKYFSPPPQTSDSSKISQSTEPPDYVSETQTIGRAPIQYAGATNGESLWALPTQQSPEASSDSNSVVGQSSLPVTGSGMDDLMADIDWDAFDTLFPPTQSHSLDFQPEFRLPYLPGTVPLESGVSTASRYTGLRD